MATSKQFIIDFSEKIKEIPEVAFRAMFGEYVLYYRGKVIGGIYNETLLVKPIKELENILPEAELRIPYEGAKPMLIVKSYEPVLIRRVFDTLYENLPVKKKK